MPPPADDPSKTTPASTPSGNTSSTSTSNTSSDTSNDEDSSDSDSSDSTSAPIISGSLILDTWVAIWLIQGDPLSVEAMTAIQNAPAIYLSNTTPLELNLEEKVLKRIPMRVTADDVVKGIEDEYNGQILPLTIPEILTAGLLPLYHVDPFDRIMVAQAIVVGLTVVSRDPSIPSYGVPFVVA